jgi:ATP-dependent HslUV protease subunit HslV
MSTVTVVRKNNQIAICADSLTKWGSEKNSAKYVVNHNKIIKIKDSYIAITGPQSGHFALKDFFENELKNEDHFVNFDSVHNIYKTFLKLQASLKEDYYLDISKQEETIFESSSMDILIANTSGIYGISAYRDVQEFTKFYAYGDGNEYALGAMFAKYDDDKLQAHDLAQLGVTAAAEFNDATELPLQCHVINLQL